MSSRAVELPTTMPAVAVTGEFPVDDPQCLTDVVVPLPTVGPRDLLVEVQAVSVNPIDTKMRRRAADAVGRGEQPILGYDAAGVVQAVGEDVTRFIPGDRVFYAGSQLRDGTNAKYHAVDERIVGHRPKTCSAVEAASLPLTALTAWEALFDRLGASIDSNGSLLILGGAGGVPSIMIQLARALTGLTVIATASREESRDWVVEMGAHEVVDHRRNLADQVLDLEPDGIDFVFTTHTTGHSGDLAEMMSPQSHLCLIDDPEDFDLLAFKKKSIAVHWESMFTRVVFDTEDLDEQGIILDRVAEMVDDGRLISTLGETMIGLTASTLAEAHREVERGHVTGKLAVRV
ncbi:MAG: zinc-binding alcohol dehydrogenase family protein [Corynebacterium sp.]|uniref:zinc-binding alcohol dehydrogenase family protein n=1 Tax=Corynebacterium sp. TaxID=1720 RepID=UPI003F993CD8